LIVDCDSQSRLTTLLLERMLGVLALHWGVLFIEARELMWVVPTKVFADLLLSLVTLRFPERTA
jgi:hypothetical protein